MYHGGNLTEATRLFGEPPEGWLDLSTGINPSPYPDTALLPQSLAQLPQPGAQRSLMDAARLAYGVPDDVALLAGSGTEMLIDLVARQSRARSVAIVGPTYGGHVEAWTRAGVDVAAAGSLEAAVALESDAVVVVNPNNPDGRVCKPQVLADAGRTLSSRGRLLIVDEAFVDVAPALSLVPLLGSWQAIVLRSFGKFYGLAGLRLGFAIGAGAEIDKLAAAVPPWSVSGPALEIGARALSDLAWSRNARAVIQEQSHRLERHLEHAGFEPVANAGLFVLASHDAAIDIHTALARAGIWTRVFDYNPRWIRFGLPPVVEWSRLERALAQAVAGK